MTERDLFRRLAGLSQSAEGFPRVLGVERAESALRIGLEVSSDLCWFAGHFPEYPVLPGVVQLHWAVLVCRHAFDFAAAPREIKRLKFRRLVIPPRTLELVVSREGAAEAQFAFVSSDEQHSEGRLVFPGPG